MKIFSIRNINYSLLCCGLLVTLCISCNKSANKTEICWETVYITKSDLNDYASIKCIVSFRNIGTDNLQISNDDFLMIIYTDTVSFSHMLGNNPKKILSKEVKNLVLVNDQIFGYKNSEIEELLLKNKIRLKYKDVNVMRSKDFKVIDNALFMN